MLPSNQLWRLRGADSAKFRTKPTTGPVSKALDAMPHGGKTRTEQPVKVGYETSGPSYYPGGYQGSLQQALAAPVLAHSVLSDPELTPAQRAVLLSAVRGAASSGNLSTAGLMGAAIGAGAGLAGGVVVGRVLGALVGLSPNTQQAIATVGGIAGLLNASGAL